MNIWRWVNDTERRLRREGQGRLAELIDRLPTEVCEDRHARADAIYPEALALARSLDLPWVEVFLRHWMLQSRVLHRMEGTTALSEAVALVDYAHRPETKECPQAVCAVQDLASCYGLVDGPGFAEERLAVCDETLARIDPTWPCYGCISAEYAAAMRDNGQMQESLAFVDRQVGKMVAAGDADATYDLPNARIEPLIAMGRLDEALAFIADCQLNGRKDASHQMERRIDLARVHVRAGRVEEARAALPALEEILDTPQHYPGWADALERLVLASAVPNDHQVGQALCRFSERLLRQGVGRTTIEIAEKHAHLALARGAPHVAQRALALMEKALPVLRKPLDALDRISRLRKALAAAPPLSAVPLPDDPEALVEAAIAEDPERALLLLEAGAGRWPTEAVVTRALAQGLVASGHDEEARARLLAFFEAGEGPPDLALVMELAELIRRAGDRAAFDELVAACERRGDATLPPWLRAVDAFARGDTRVALQQASLVVERVPDAKNARRLAAEAARQLGEFAVALARLDELCVLVPEPGPHDWDRMTAATIVGDHAKVRDSAARLGLPVQPGEGPIDDDWGLCRIRFAEDEPYEPFAQRTGPVTARILQIRRPGMPQHFDDLVVFDAQPLNPPPANDEERKEHVFLYPCAAVLREGGRTSYAIDGVHPGVAAVDALRERLRALDCPLQVASDETYQVGEDGDLPGLYAFVAPASDLPTIHEALRAFSEGLAHPLVWPELASAAGDHELVAAQAEVRAKYRL
ncbi:MAG: hypothetical protein JNL79_32920 [Myxococcales bacterium]|nr:hypothetical protein [Myxococcales bacterium]